MGRFPITFNLLRDHARAGVGYPRLVLARFIRLWPALSGKATASQRCREAARFPVVAASGGIMVLWSSLLPWLNPEAASLVYEAIGKGDIDRSSFRTNACCR